MFNKTRISAILLLLLVFFLFSEEHVNVKNDKQVAVIAHSPSTAIKAKEQLTENGWVEISPKKADKIIVVCKSFSISPLKSEYACYCKLDSAVGKQLNITGKYVHIYLYKFHDNLTVTELSHDYSEAESYFIE